MFWADRIAKKIIESREYRPYYVDDMFTPSGFAHIGSLRGPLVHDMIYRAIKSAGKNVKWTYIFNDFDPIDGLPPELQSKFNKYLGIPLRVAPSPEKGFSSFADYFASDFKNVLVSLGVRAEFLSSWDMYHQGLFNNVIKIALDNSEKIQDIYQKVSGSKKREIGWLPLQVICEKCGKLGSTKVYKWDGKIVYYKCEVELVTWAKGCGFNGKTSPYNGHGKLPWKVDWPAHWAVLGVTIEGAGKDHSSAGGSRDIAKALCKEVFKIPEPFNLPYEFFLIGGRKMSSSKGLGLKGRDLTNLFPPEVGRFLFTRTDYSQSIEFEPAGTMAIPDLFDEYDRCWQSYINGQDKDLAASFIFSQINQIPEKKPTFLPRFRDIANFIQNSSMDIFNRFFEIKDERLTVEEKSILEERIKFGKIWLDHFAPDDFVFKLSESIPHIVTKLTSDQKKYLTELAKLLKTKEFTPDKLQNELFVLSQKLKIPPKSAFESIYIALIGKTHGPKAGWFLTNYDKNIIIERLREAIVYKSPEKKGKCIYSIIHRPDLFTVDSKLKNRFPSVTIGIAVIKNVKIKKEDKVLNKEISNFIKSQQNLTTREISDSPEIQSYHRIYKETGVDWHSKRPSPEALLRRIATKKDLPKINTCVDAYNLVVMKNKVSVGAFNLDKIKFPTTLRLTKKGDRILLLGDKDYTYYRPGEVAYFDKIEGYNIDFNYLDSDRTKVDENTKNLWINVEGVYEITRDQVEKTLKKTIEILINYCGGKLEIAGIVK